MHSLKKLISALSLMLAFTAWTVGAEEWQNSFIKVFDIHLAPQRISFGINGNDSICSAFFFDSYNDELCLVLCDSSEYGKLKETAFECKKLAKSVSTFQEYERKNIYLQITTSLTELAEFSLQDYVPTEFGFVKMRLYNSPLLSATHPDVEDFVVKILSNSKNSSRTETFVAGQEWSMKRDIYDWYTALDQINTCTNEKYPSSVRVQVALGYKKDDKATATEITAHRIEITDFLRRFFSELTTDDLKPQNE